MDGSIQNRYREKISIINYIDPFSLDIKKGSSNPEDFPRCNLWCIGSYLVHKTSVYTSTDFDAYKSLQAHTQFVCGWVRDVCVYEINNWHVVVGKVMHSMRTREKPLNAWIIASKNGVIESAHCTCMVGLAEACTHIAAILFYIESASSFIQEKSVTDVPAYWVAPAAVQKVAMSQIDETTFSKSNLCSTSGENDKPSKRKTKVKELSDEEYRNVLEELSKIPTANPIALLTIVKPFCDKYENKRNKRIQTVASNPDEVYPPKLKNLFKEELKAQFGKPYKYS